jgi:hypothetical protein
MRILRLAVREGKRCFNRREERIFVDSIRGGARGTTVDNGPNRNIQPAFCDVLVYGVVGKTRETAGGLVDMNFRFISARGLREAQNSFDD